MSTAAAKFLRQMGSVEAGLLTQAGILLQTTIATLGSQTSFTLTAGSANNDAYNECTIVVTDAVTATQKAVGLVGDYTGSTKTVTLASDPGIFTMAVGDSVVIVPKTAALDVVDTIVDAILVDTSTTLDDLIDTEIATIVSDVAAILVDTGTTLDALLTAVHTARPQVSTYNFTEAANAGATVALTVGGAPLWVTGVTLSANGVTTVDMTDCAIGVGAAATLHEFISAATAVEASLNAAGERLISTAVPVRLEVGDVIVGLLVGTGATALDLDLAVSWWGEGATSTLT